MALNTEIWLRSLVEDFWPDNSFIQRSVDHSAYVNNHTVHVPQGGVAPAVTKNRTSFPATIKEREDSDLTYNLDIFDTEPILVHQLDLVELSYDKRNSILRQAKTQLQQEVQMSILKIWAAGAGNTIKTTGAGEDAHVHTTATGKRNAFCRADVMALHKQMNMDNVPAEGRTVLLDAVMYDQLLNSLTNAENVNFLAGADPQRGVLGKFMGFDFMMRSSVLTTAAGGSLKTGAASASDCAAGLCWHRDSVARALGEVVAYESIKDPTYYGDILSFAMRAGGRHLRSDKKGIILIHQGTEA